MSYSVDILNRMSESFNLWVPGWSSGAAAPQLVLGQYKTDTADDFNVVVRQALQTPYDTDSLWALNVSALSPTPADGVYHYWFDVNGKSVTDPFAFAVDYTHTGPRGEDVQPPGVIKISNGKLLTCDYEGQEPERPSVPDLSKVPSNEQLVIYELPTSWVKSGSDERGSDVDVGTFSDVEALFTASEKKGKKRASSTSTVQPGPAVLAELGINALELLPAADAKVRGAWGYATANYFAPDFDLGTASDLVSLVNTLHEQNIRLFTDVVMAFGHDPYGTIDFQQFHIVPENEPQNPDSYQSNATGTMRMGYGGMLWRYLQNTNAYDPETGKTTDLHPSWAFHHSHLARWMADFGVGGLRLDSLNNVGNWDFIKSYKEKAWELYNARYGGNADPSKFLVVGEELNMPNDMVSKGVVDALWNEHWQSRLRAAIIGEGFNNDDLEWTVRKLVDCSLDDSISLNPTQSINYITSHDIEGGDAKNRLYNFCVNKGIQDIGKRAKLAFALLLTSVGIPMIFAGEEFADQEDSSLDMTKKQTDPVNYERLLSSDSDAAWRQDLFAYVSRLVKFRTSTPALGGKDTNFIHTDHTSSGTIMAWTRGGGYGQAPVVVVVNFGDQDTPGDEYVVPNWPNKDATGWREVSQDRDVPQDWVGREPLKSWEAKIYTYGSQEK